MTVRTKWKLSIAIWFLVGIPLGILSVEGCSLQRRPNPLNEDSLRIRVQQFYDHFGNRRFDGCYEFFSPKKMTFDKKEFVQISKRFYHFTSSDYRIESITLDGLNARVEMHMSTVEKGKNYASVTFDSWSFTDGNWYIIGFGRTE